MLSTYQYKITEAVNNFKQFLTLKLNGILSLLMKIQMIRKILENNYL